MKTIYTFFLLTLIMSGCTHSVKSYENTYVIKKIIFNKSSENIKATIQLHSVMGDDLITATLLAEDIISKKYNEGDTLKLRVEELYISDLLIGKSVSNL
jgi:hypothetical protein